MYESMHAILGQLRATAERIELDDEGAARDLGAQLLDEQTARRRRAPGGDEIVDQQYPVVRGERVYVHFEPGRSILEIVIGSRHVIRKLAGFAQRDKSNAELPGNQAAEDKTARFHSDHRREAFAEEGVEELVHREPQSRRILDQRGDVFELDPGLGKVRDIADLGFESIHGRDDYTAS